jgi:hypothetical protein
MLFAAPRNLSTSLILASSFFVGPNTVGRTASPLAQLLRKPLLAPHRRRTAQLCTCSQPHLGVWLLLGVGPSPGLAPRLGPLNSAPCHHIVNVPMSGRAPVTIHIRRCWVTVGTVDTALTGCRPKWLTKILCRCLAAGDNPPPARARLPADRCREHCPTPAHPSRT